MVAADGRAAVRLKAAPTSAADARAHARAILREHRFQRSHPPRPFKRPLHWLGDRLHALAEHTPGGRWTLRDLFAAIVLAAAAVAAVRLARRRTGARMAARPPGDAGAPAFDPRALEREADRAESRGELELALRLRFRAGLLRLDRARRIEFRESLTSGEVARALRSGHFDDVARTFDEVVYGRRAPVVPDLERSRAGWARILEEAA